MRDYVEDNQDNTEVPVVLSYSSCSCLLGSPTAESPAQLTPVSILMVRDDQPQKARLKIRGGACTTAGTEI